MTLEQALERMKISTDAARLKPGGRNAGALLIEVAESPVAGDWMGGDVTNVGACQTLGGSGSK